MQKYYHTTLKLWKLLKPFHENFYIQLFLIIIGQAMQVFSVVLMAKLLDSMVNKNFNFAYLLIISIFLFFIIRQIVSYIADYYSISRLDENIQQFLEEYSFDKIFKLNLSQYIEDHSAIKLQVISRGENSIEDIIKTIFLNLLPTFTQVIFSILAIAYYSVSISLIVFITMLIVIYWSNRFTNFHRPYVKKDLDNWDNQKKVRTETFQHLNLIRINAVEGIYLSDYLKNRFSYINHTIVTRMLRLNHGYKRNTFFYFSRSISSMLLVYAFSIGSITIGAVYAIWMWMSDVFNNIYTLVQSMRTIPLRFIELEKYLDIIDKEADFDEVGNINFAAGDIIFENVNFKYPASEKDVIKNINIIIKEGQKTAFVGTSGSGKSTIIKLLLRIYDYNMGNIKINNQELKDISSVSLRQNIGYVEQHVDLFDTSIRENILLGLTDKNIDENHLSQIIHKSRIDQFFHRLTSGLDTQIGERGVKLSGGERQRIGIARALIKNPSILIFDEATASLDTENEKYIQEAIDESSIGRTSIIIAHRLSTVQNADMIYVMHKGEIVGGGTHTQLLESNQYYQNLIKHQF